MRKRFVVLSIPMSERVVRSGPSTNFSQMHE